MKCDKCGISMYAMTPHYMDNEDRKLYCENCYKNKLAGKGKILTFIYPLSKEGYKDIKIKFEKIYIPKTEELRLSLNSAVNVMFNIISDLIEYAENPVKENEIDNVSYMVVARDGYVSFYDFDF